MIIKIKSGWRRSGVGYAKRLYLFSVIAYFVATIPAYLYASQDLSASGGTRPLSGINWTWLDRMGGTLTWGRNPFSFPRTGPEPIGADDGRGLQLTAILYHKAGGVAIINKRIVRPGDSIEGKDVVSILEDRVVLKDLSGVLELKLDAFGFK